MSLKFTQKISVSPEVLFQEVDGETVLLDLQGESYFGLDKVGTRIWQLMQTHTDLQTIYDSMLEEFDVEPERLEKDLLTLLKDLTEEGLVTLQS